MKKSLGGFLRVPEPLRVGINSTAPCAAIRWSFHVCWEGCLASSLVNGNAGVALGRLVPDGGPGSIVELEPFQPEAGDAPLPG